jgi:hypothetical protein
MGSMATVKRPIRVEPDRIVTLDVGCAAVAEQVTVHGNAVPVVTNPTIGANFNAKLINDLPTGRTPFTIAELAPGLTDNGPNAGQITIAGAFAYDNVFLINGVDVNDNIFGTNNNLFIEDAIEETQVLTSGISAEYGRFSGGVINIVTKRGGDIYSGSYRHNLSNASWTDETPFETRERGSLLERLEVRSAGRSSLQAWFFSAGRYENSTEATFPRPASATTPASTTSYELKGTFRRTRTRRCRSATPTTAPCRRTGPASPAPSTFLLVTFAVTTVRRQLDGVRRRGSSRRRRSQTPGLPQHRRHQHRVRTAVPHPRPQRHPGQPALQRAVLRLDRSGRPRQPPGGGQPLNAAVVGRGGGHDLGAAEWFRSTNTGGNSQTSTMSSTRTTDNAGVPVFDSQDRLIPRFVRGRRASTGWQRRVARDGVALRARSLGGEPQADGRRGPALRARAERRHRRHHRRRHRHRGAARSATYDAKGDGGS